MIEAMLKSMLGDNPEKMIAGLIGVPPEQIDAIGRGLFELATEGVANIKAIRADVAAIKRHLNIPESEVGNDNGTGAD